MDNSNKVSITVEDAIYCEIYALTQFKYGLMPYDIVYFLEGLYNYVDTN